MKLSWWIFQKFLSDYNTEIFYTEDSISIEEVRLYDKDGQTGKKLSENILYLWNVKDLFQNGTAINLRWNSQRLQKYIEYSTPVICFTVSGYMVVSETSINCVLNRILDAFSVYARWGESCVQKINEGCTLAELLNLGEKQLGFPLLIVDASQYVIAQSTGMEGTVGSETWEKNGTLTSFPSEVLKKFNQLHADSFEKKRTFFLPEDVFPSQAYCKHIFLNEERLATLILPIHKSVKEASTYLSHALEIFSGFIQQWMEQSHSEDATSQLTSYFARTLDNSEQASPYLNHRLALFGWEEFCRKQLYILQSASEQIHFDSYLSRIFSDNFNGTYAIPYHKKIVILVNQDILKKESFEENLCFQMQKNNYYGVVGLTYTNMKHTSEAYYQCDLLLQQAVPEKGVLIDCQKQAMTYITDLVKRNAVFDLIHPIVRDLRKYDAENKTDFYKTLFCYLKNERNHQRTATELYIHRNTLFLRLSKIQSIWKLNLEDAQERFYLLYSFYQDGFFQDNYPIP